MAGIVDTLKQKYVRGIKQNNIIYEPDEDNIVTLPGADTTIILLSLSARTMSQTFLIWLASARDEPPNLQIFILNTSTYHHYYNKFFF